MSLHYSFIAARARARAPEPAQTEVNFKRLSHRG